MASSTIIMLRRYSVKVPWFKDQTVKLIFNVEELSRDHFYWPDLDVDLSLEIIENPDHFLLKAKRG